MTFFSTDTKKAKPADDTPKTLKALGSNDVKAKPFDFSGGSNRYPNVKRLPVNKPGGPMFSSQLRDMEDNKKRLAVSAAKKAAQATATAAPVKKKGGRPKKKAE